MVGYQLQAAFGTEMIEEPENDGVAMSRRNFTNIDHPFVSLGFLHVLSSLQRFYF
jgi:hypothetical protein